MQEKDLSYIFRTELSEYENWKKFKCLSRSSIEFKFLAEDKLNVQLLRKMPSLNNWAFKYISTSSRFVWYIKEQNKTEHFKIELYNCGYSFSISAGNNPYLNVRLFPKLLLDLRFRPLLLSENFGRVDYISTYKIIEEGNYQFATINDGRIDVEDMEWFAFHETDNLVNQIIEKVSRFLSNQKLTQLIIELNSEIDDEIKNS